MRGRAVIALVGVVDAVAEGAEGNCSVVDEVTKVDLENADVMDDWCGNACYDQEDRCCKQQKCSNMVEEPGCHLVGGQWQIMWAVEEEDWSRLGEVVARAQTTVVWMNKNSGTAGEDDWL